MPTSHGQGQNLREIAEGEARGGGLGQGCDDTSDINLADTAPYGNHRPLTDPPGPLGLKATKYFSVHSLLPVP